MGDRDRDRPHRKERRTLDYEGALDTDEAAALLQSLTDGLRSGTVRVERGEEGLSLHPAGELAVTVTARRKGSKERLAIELSWRRAPERPAPEPGGPLRITSVEPGAGADGACAGAEDAGPDETGGKQDG